MLSGETGGQLLPQVYTEVRLEPGLPAHYLASLFFSDPTPAFDAALSLGSPQGSFTDNVGLFSGQQVPVHIGDCSGYPQISCVLMLWLPV